MRVSVNMDAFGLPGSTGKTFEMHDVWSGEVRFPVNDNITCTLEACDCLVFRCKVVDRVKK